MLNGFSSGKGHFRCKSHRVWSEILEYLSSLTSQNTHLELEYLSENVPVCCQDVCLGVCRRIMFCD